MKKDPKTVPVGPAPTLDTRAIPRHIKTNLAQVVFDAVQAEFLKPGVMEDYLKWKEARAAEYGSN